MYRLKKRLDQKRDGGDTGFTLIELLVVITILGILAGITVFSVSGLGDRGKGASQATEASILRTAEEAYYATPGHGEYTDLAGLRAGNKYLTTDPGYNQLLLSPDHKSYSVGQAGSVFAGTTGPRFLAASNNTPGFNFLAPGFVAANRAVQFSFGASSGLATTATGGPAGPGNNDLLFLSADEANVNKTYTSAAGAGGTCAAVDCAGIFSTKRQYTTGHLALFSCKDPATPGGVVTLPAIQGGIAGCAVPPGGYLPSAPTGLPDIVTRLRTSRALATPCSGFKLAVADPGAGSPPTAPYGLAAKEALENAAGGGLAVGEFADLHTNNCIVYAANQNVTATQTLVRNGTAQAALIPKSFVVSPGGNDTNWWSDVNSALHNPIRQFAIVLNHGTGGGTAPFAAGTDQALAKAFLDYLITGPGLAVLAAYGYDPVS